MAFGKPLPEIIEIITKLETNVFRRYLLNLEGEFINYMHYREALGQCFNVQFTLF